MAMQNVENSVVWDGYWRVSRHHSRLSAISSFDRAHTTSYSTFIETATFTRYIAIEFVESSEFSPTAYLHFGVIPFEFSRDLLHHKTKGHLLPSNVVCLILHTVL